ncbi:tetratricopeptide repeat protein [Marinobacteraceae bacterium S3BR75-40.1]
MPEIGDTGQNQAGTEQKTIEPLPPEQAAKVETARQAVQQGRYQDARAILTALLQTYPDHPDLRANLGIVEKALKHEDAAREQFEKALESSPGHAVAANNLALLEQHSGDFKQARTLLERAIEANPDNARLHYNLAVLCELYLMDLNAALAHYQRYQELRSEPDPEVANWIVDLKRRAN